MTRPRGHTEGSSSVPLADLEELLRLKKVLSRILPAVEEGAHEGASSPFTGAPSRSVGDPVGVPGQGAGENNDIETVLNAFGILEGFQMTRSLLAKSRIGLCVGALRRHPDGRIKAKSTALVAKWKSAIGTQASKSSATGGSNNKEIPAATAGRGTPAAAASAASSSSAPALESNSAEGRQAPKMTTGRYPGPISGDSTRDKARTFLWRALVDGLETAAAAAAAGSATAGETGRVAAAIEEALWSRFIVDRQSTKEYNAQLKTLKWNLADPKNPDLNLKVLWGMYTADQLANMTSAELASEEKKRERDKQKQESLEACQSDWEVRRMMSSGEAAQGQFPCFRCRTNKTVYFQMQTRSSDEPMTTFVTCLECGNRWKF
ncbi:transcription elongation factor S-II [Cyclospora cayetanensis]|uniref:Transcription elongation factor S-II n=1 Tax=Cyclospora cayetanensis TaxID=88456 RepID=A0A6P6RQH8_9EIME|nr:transcription elongation factor S-II [Cyclospora cayetanensis]